MTILRTIFWPIVVAYRSLDDAGDFFPFAIAMFFTFVIAGAAVATFSGLPPHFILIALLAYLISAPIFFRAEAKFTRWEFPYSLICNVSAGIIWMIALIALFTYWQSIISLVF